MPFWHHHSYRVNGRKSMNRRCAGIVYKYKRKTGYHKKNGHRQLYTQIKIDKINA